MTRRDAFVDERWTSGQGKRWLGDIIAGVFLDLVAERFDLFETRRIGGDTIQRWRKP